MVFAPRSYRVIGWTVASLLVVAAGACSSPLDTPETQSLRSSVSESVEREAAPARAGGGNTPLTLQRAQSTLTFKPEIEAELERMAGPASYPEALPPIGPDLLGKEAETFAVSLRQAVTAAVQNNLSVELAQLEPSISGARAVAAEAAFDWVFFASGDWTNTDEPQTVRAVGAFPTGTAASVSESAGYTTGLRKPLTTGGAVRVFQGLTYLDDRTPGSNSLPDPSYRASLFLELSQPLLRNLGSDVALAEVRIARNAERAATQQLKAQLISTVTETERAYWDLVQARRSLQVQQRLLERGIATRDVLESRRNFDVKPAEFSDAVATVKAREGNVIRSINRLRQASDTLKALMNDPNLTVGSETLLVPVDAAVDEPISYTLLDSITTALANRPEVQQSILDIDDASIRMTVADNAKLPLLDLALQTGFSGLDDDAGTAYEEIGEADYVDYVVRLDFEQPIGNRVAEANYRARTLERLRATVGYRRIVQEVVLAVKRSLRDVQTNYQLIEQSRSSRLAATENLRTLEVQKKTIQALSPEFLNLEFQRQESLALAELEEIAALVNYNTALADLYAATGTALERNQIKFVAPGAGEATSP